MATRPPATPSNTVPWGCNRVPPEGNIVSLLITSGYVAGPGPCGDRGDGQDRRLGGHIAYGLLAHWIPRVPCSAVPEPRAGARCSGLRAVPAGCTVAAPPWLNARGHRVPI